MGLQKKLSKLNAKIERVESRVAILEQDNKTLRQDNKTLHQENKDLREENSRLEKSIEKLKSEKAPKKNSTNSSIPPSKDENRVKKNQSLRKSTGLKSGGQKGHKGNTLKMSKKADEIKIHIPYTCQFCGDLLENDYELIGKRQVIDIPPIQPKTIEHQIYSVSCKCGMLNKSDYPKQVKSPVSYGVNIEVLINYLSTRQYISLARIEEFLDQVMGVKMSQGTIVNKLKSFQAKAKRRYEQIRKKVSQSSVVGADETGCVVNGDKHWMWTWQTERETFIAVSQTRGFDAVENNFSHGFPNSILVSDCWAAQLKTKSKAHQICIAHLQRELNYFIEIGKETWSTKFVELISEALELKSKMKQKTTKYFRLKVKQIIKKSKKLIAQKIDGPPKLITLKNRLLKRFDSLWVFLQHYNVPPDNNASERAIRNVKVKQKVSGQFKSIDGAIHFTMLRSIIDTAIKNDVKIFDAMTKIALS